MRHFIILPFISVLLIGCNNSSLDKKSNNDTTHIYPTISYKGKFTATIYRDAEDAYVQPNHLVMEEKIVTENDTVVLPLAADGGAVIWIR